MWDERTPDPSLLPLGFLTNSNLSRQDEMKEPGGKWLWSITHQNSISLPLAGI